ncbi:hypothetical protein ColTof4_14064 [Colletotrichum tofieldiae]|nr:hypothetical protein ColTof3_14700 [Colletotrichum tofieldiae]GKT81641.1 hypothetical protein ColTof4_14064 [Colletotrichum tofieldiae]GKT97616.1 hypothetical protein Ct61P_15466 [Colletotrichum tofieldiae]
MLAALHLQPVLPRLRQRRRLAFSSLALLARFRHFLVPIARLDNTLGRVSAGEGAACSRAYALGARLARLDEVGSWDSPNAAVVFEGESATVQVTHTLRTPESANDTSAVEAFSHVLSSAVELIESRALAVFSTAAAASTSTVTGAGRPRPTHPPPVEEDLEAEREFRVAIQHGPLYQNQAGHRFGAMFSVPDPGTDGRDP